MIESPLVDSGFDVPVFSPGDNPIACLNKATAFLTVVASSRFPSTNNQLRTSLNLRNHDTIQDGRVTVQQVHGRQGQSYSGTGYKSNATSFGGNNASGQARVVKCYNCQGSWKILDEEQLTFLADPWVPHCQVVQTIIPNNAAFQTEDLDTYDSDCDDILNAKPVLMANISNYGSNVISEVVQIVLWTKDEAHEAIIKFIKNIQVCLNAIVRNVRTDNGTEFVNQTLREFYENVGISHQTSVARTPQQNSIVERRNQTLIEAAPTMFKFSKALINL
ncbi:retrovirus-related pol polyprotein from transposon TNT 1-94 [Tanacetum coccineum]